MLAQDLNNDVEVKFVGFKPSAEIQDMVNTLTDELYMESPSDSFLKITFTIRNGMIKGFIQISSAVGKFFAAAEDVDVHSLAKKLAANTQEKLANWRLQRQLGAEDLTQNMIANNTANEFLHLHHQHWF